MSAPKCRCGECGALVEQWIGMVCIPCHDLAVARKAIEPFATTSYRKVHAGGVYLEAWFDPQEIEEARRIYYGDDR